MKHQAGKTNKISRPTENIALTYTNKIDNKKLIIENAEYEQKAEPLRESVGKVDRMLKALNNEQKLVIQTYYFYEPKWNYVTTKYFEIYKESKTVNQLKNIRNIAINIMLDVINI